MFFVLGFNLNVSQYLFSTFVTFKPTLSGYFVVY
ncbi:hypothetical protein [Staphylococcus phage vB_SauM-V1SA19]|nr:hypothetical protein [Staphylococcus phage vB_SauM-V1SA19]UVT34977.1 hypothetical protein [Staphylococcus phage vB_SauM-V1SA20]